MLEHLHHFYKEFKYRILTFLSMNRESIVNFLRGEKEIQDNQGKKGVGNIFGDWGMHHGRSSRDQS